MSLNATILKVFKDFATEEGVDLEAIEAQTELLATGIDSLGFAIVVAMLEEELGYDPFTLMDEPFYPRTFGEFVEMYERFAP